LILVFFLLLWKHFWFSDKMNARSQTFEFAVEGRQIDEVVSCMFHTILFHRCVGKVCWDRFSYKCINSLIVLVSYKR
jgi:hypothetical protein